MSNMRWSEARPDPSSSPVASNSNSRGGAATTPQIKNHSVTHHRGHLYCFGGYDGRRNHQTLLIYSLKKQRWITPSGIISDTSNGSVNGGIQTNERDNQQYDSRMNFTVRGVAPPGRNGHTATLATCRSSQRRGRRRHHRVDPSATDNNDNGENRGNADNNATTTSSDAPPSSGAKEVVDKALAELATAIDAMDAELDSNTPGSVNDKQNSDSNHGSLNGNNAQGGDDVMSNNELSDDGLNQSDQDNAPENLGEDLDDDDDDAQIIIIGGWLGSGPLAASDMWVLDISGGLERLRWHQPPILGTPPGPCNMHSADFIPTRNEVYVFRGGNGQDYLNDLHALDVQTYVWRTVQTHGCPPQQRANHSSALLDDNGGTASGTSELFVFGGWNGNERLNDIHVLDTATSTWSTPRALGVKPFPRAGMTLTALRGRLYLFGGSGTSSKCFDDLQVLDRKEMAWLDVNEEEDSNKSHGNAVLQPLGTSHYNTWEMINGRNCDASTSNNQRDRTTSSSWEMLGGQDGMMVGGGDDTGIKFADWRSYPGSSGCQQPCSSANPNDEDMVPSVYVNGKAPGRRAGHTATAVGRHIFVFGGSCGTDYLNDFFVLDTDPPPLMKITEPPSPQLYASRLRHFYNDEEFSDVTFLVEGQKVFGHKLVLSTVSDCFRAMFMTGFRESGSQKAEIEIPNCSYSSFVIMMEYIYTGRGPNGIDVFTSDGMDRAIALLELADQFFLYNLKQIIEADLQPAVNEETHSFLRQVAQKTNANQLELYCRYFERNMTELLE